MKPKNIRLVCLLEVLRIVSAANSPSSRCTSITAPRIPGVEIISIEGKYTQNYKLNTEYQSHPEAPSDNTSGLEFCDVTIYLSHPGDNDNVKLSIWLPPDEKWNGRFQATGGGGFTTVCLMSNLMSLLNLHALRELGSPLYSLLIRVSLNFIPRKLSAKDSLLHPLTVAILAAMEAGPCTQMGLSISHYGGTSHRDRWPIWVSSEK